MKTPIKTIEVRSDGIYCSELEKPSVEYQDTAPEAYEQALFAYTSSLIKVENDLHLGDGLKISNHLFDVGATENIKGNDYFKEGTYPAPDGLVMEVKEIGELNRDGKLYATVSFLPDKEEEKKCCKLNPNGCDDCTEFERLNPSELKEDVGEEKGLQRIKDNLNEHPASGHLWVSRKDLIEVVEKLSPQEKPEGWISVERLHDVFGAYRESLKAEMNIAIEKQEAQQREEYNKGIEETCYLALSMLEIHLKYLPNPPKA
jgi:hypothetical protein